MTTLATLNRIEPEAEDMTEVENLVEELFTYKEWTTEQIHAGTEVKNALKDAYLAILVHVPSSPMRTTALNSIVNARLQANTAITFGGNI